MNSPIFVCALFLAIITPIIMHEPCKTLQAVCDRFSNETADGTFEKKNKDFLSCRAKVLGDEVEAAVKKCWEKLPMDTKDDMAKVCADLKGNADEFEKGRACVNKAIASKQDQMKECMAKLTL